jgi:hypothetical protein
MQRIPVSSPWHLGIGSPLGDASNITDRAVADVKADTKVQLRLVATVG